MFPNCSSEGIFRSIMNFIDNRHRRNSRKQIADNAKSSEKIPPFSTHLFTEKTNYPPTKVARENFTRARHHPPPNSSIPNAQRISTPSPKKDVSEKKNHPMLTSKEAIYHDTQRYTYICAYIYRYMYIFSAQVKPRNSDKKKSTTKRKVKGNNLQILERNAHTGFLPLPLHRSRA